MTKIQTYLEEHKEEYKPWLVDNEQGRVDIKILPYLKDIESGFFVEAGALDGLFMSNTKLLEDLGWNGLLIEPSRKAVERCRQNRKVQVEQVALVSNDYKEEFVSGDFLFDGEYGIGAWSSIQRNAYGQQTGGKFLAMKTNVKAETLQSVLNRNKVKKVDFLSLDVEGYEMEVLKGVNLNEIDIRYILIEVNLRDYSLDEMNEYLEQFNYKNLGCLSGFSKDVQGWDGSHNDYLYMHG